MKFYDYAITPDKLVINKKTKRVIVEKLYIVMQVIILSIAFGIVIYVTASGKILMNWVLAIASCFAILLFILYFGKFFKERNIHIFKSNDGMLLLNNKSIGSIHFIEAIILEEYVSADAITGIKNIKLVINGIFTPIIQNVNESDSYAIAEILKKFLELPNLEVVEKIY